MIEDDTFRVLKRTPYTETLTLLKEAVLWRKVTARNIDGFLYQHGWTLEEYNKADGKYLAEQDHD